MKRIRGSFLSVGGLAAPAVLAAGLLAGCGGGGSSAADALTGGGGGSSNQISISGTISGAIVSGVTVLVADSVTGARSASTTTDSSGVYSFTGLPNDTGTIITIAPIQDGYTFTPPFRTLAPSATAQTFNFPGQNFTATARTSP